MGDLSKKFSEGTMGHALFSGLGVPDDVLSSYERSSKHWEGSHHAYCVGVADPTDALPEGTVFVTGFGVECPDRDILITRFPCTEKSDGRILSAISSRPKKMNEEDWKMLCSMHFGMLIFATPNDPGVKSIPETIADGDLDGDPYFICWDSDIVSCIKVASTTESEQLLKNSDTSVKHDPILGFKFRHKDSKGDLQDAKVIKAEVEGYYTVEITGQQISMTHEEIMDGRGFIEKITNHRRKGRGLEVYVVYCDGVNEWTELDNILKKEVPELLTEYAINHDLQKDFGWGWIERHMQDAGVTDIISHRAKGKLLEIKELYDDGTTHWASMGSIKKDGDDEEKDKLFEYAKEKNLLNRQGFTWLKVYSNQKVKAWFENLQNHMADVTKKYDHNRLTTMLFSAYKKMHEKKGINDDDTVALGRAFKQSLDIQKHGGKVKVPYYLRSEIKEKAFHNYLDFDTEGLAHISNIYSI